MEGDLASDIREGWDSSDFGEFLGPGSCRMFFADWGVAASRIKFPQQLLATDAR